MGNPTAKTYSDENTSELNFNYFLKQSLLDANGHCFLT